MYTPDDVDIAVMAAYDAIYAMDRERKNLEQQNAALRVRLSEMAAETERLREALANLSLSAYYHCDSDGVRDEITFECPQGTPWDYAQSVLDNQ